MQQILTITEYEVNRIRESANRLFTLNADWPNRGDTQYSESYLRGELVLIEGMLREILGDKGNERNEKLLSNVRAGSEIANAVNDARQGLKSLPDASNEPQSAILETPKEETRRKKREWEVQRSKDVQEAYAYHCEIHGLRVMPLRKLPERVKLISDAIDLAGLEVVKKASLGVKLDPFNNGANDSGTKFNSIEYALGERTGKANIWKVSAKKIERFSQLTENNETNNHSSPQRPPNSNRRSESYVEQAVRFNEDRATAYYNAIYGSGESDGDGDDAGNARTIDLTAEDYTVVDGQEPGATGSEAQL